MDAEHLLMEKITTIEDFRTKANELMGRMAIINELYREADKLVRSVDLTAIVENAGDKEAEYDAYEIAGEIRNLGRYVGDGVDRRYPGFWLPSTC